MTKKTLPVYIGDFADYDIVNVPMSQSMRWTLVDFLRALLDSQDVFETFFAVPFSAKYRQLMRTLLVPLTSNIRYKENREPTRKAIAEYEKQNRVIVLPNYREKSSVKPDTKKNLSQATDTVTDRQFPPVKTMVQAASLLSLVYIVVFICSIL